jgi:transcriptional regulator with XRE-family HTH domain
MLVELGRELRMARLGAGLRQVDVARAAGTSRSWISQLERGRVDEVGFRLLTVILAVVGLELRARAYPGSDPLRDAPQRAVLARMMRLLPDGALLRTEVPLPLAGDQRAWDAMTRLWGLRVGIEVETRVTDWQPKERQLMLKRRDGAVDRMILVLADTRHNRAVMRLSGLELRRAFPVQGRAARAALRATVDPGGDLLIVV